MYRNTTIKMNEKLSERVVFILKYKNNYTDIKWKN